MNPPRITIVLLTYNRPTELKRNLQELCQLNYPSLEIIVIDNCSDPEKKAGNWHDYPRIRLIELAENIGVAGRNVGIQAASGDIVITLDDDVFGLNDQALLALSGMFDNPTIGAVNFKILDDASGQLLDWCHKRTQDLYSDQPFDTVEISEGAVAFRRESLLQAGLYPAYFFISHEGPDLALRIMDLGYRVIYSPRIVVRHAHAPGGRVQWRRYYFGTRNQLWLVLRLFPLGAGIRKLGLGWSSMLVYSIRDGFFSYWLKAVIDGLRGSPVAFRDRRVLAEKTWQRYRAIQACNPDTTYLIRARLARRVIR